MTDRSGYIAFYGTLMEGMPQYERLGLGAHLKYAGPCVIRGDLYEIKDGTEHYPALTEGKGRVHAELFEITDVSFFPRMDAYEGTDEGCMRVARFRFMRPPMPLPGSISMAAASRAAGRLQAATGKRISRQKRGAARNSAPDADGLLRHTAPMPVFEVKSETELAALAARLAPQLKTGDVVTLKGDLGAGKTAFARALINALAPVPEEVPSPTFTLVQTYELPYITLWHFDLYRLEDEERDILELGWEEARRTGVALVEWPDRLGGLLPKDRLEVDIAFNDSSDSARTVTVTAFGKMAGIA
jgi:tRNA threonylcarbamoyladenosine biosynthesis protein TsaE